MNKKNMKKQQVTIPREMSFDPFYRYKRIVLSVGYIKKGGCSSVLRQEELRQLGHDLGRSVDDLIQWIRKNIKSSLSLDKDDRRWIIKREINADELDNYIEEFIHQKILCGQCDSPETEKVELTNGQEAIRCKACGFFTQ